jgi:hypothetical protein
MSFVEKAQRLNQEINATFDEAFNSLRQEMQDHLRESYESLRREIEAFKPLVPSAFLDHQEMAAAAEGVRVQARHSAFGEVREALAELDRGRSQAEILTALIASSGRFAWRTALLLVQPGGELRGWGSHGFADSAAAVASLTLPAPGDGPWEHLGAPSRLSPADCAVLCGRIESPLPELGYLVPMMLRDRLVAVLYADQAAPATGATEENTETSASLELAALQSLVYAAALAIESLAFRQRPATATLASEADPAASTATTLMPVMSASLTAPAAGAESSAPETPGEPAAASSSTPPAAESDASRAVDRADTAAAAAAAAADNADHAVSDAASAGESEESAAASSTAGGSLDAGAASDRPHSPSAPSAGFAAPPFAVTPATLYDVPSVPVAQQTAEMPRVAAATTGAANDIRHASPYLEDADGAVNAPAPGARAGDEGDDREEPGGSMGEESAAPAAVQNETVMLPHAALRDAGVTPWGRRTADLTHTPASGPLPSFDGDAATHTEAPPALAHQAADISFGSHPASATPPQIDTSGAAGAAPAATELPASPPPSSLGGSPDPLQTMYAPGAVGVAAPAAPSRHQDLDATRDDASPPMPVLHPPASGGAETWGAGSLRAVPPPAADTQRAVSGPVPVPFPPSLPATSTGSSPTLTGSIEAVRGPAIGSATPEVRPPSGVQGPGWAFATTRIASAPSDEAIHEEARRLARLLVSEIKLYNEEQVEAGRRNRDIYERLREDIDRSRQMYEERVDPKLLKTTDYFYQELVRILAAGDSKALGI